ncbi:site-specific integrase [Acidaminobacter sp. JC074]|uniref:tyrosine-type recombinase/integrase n=1 Tax=Acidaminobacter sp. JC074 TaxID=2530199 RepID=UPI001F0EF7F5|nr:tyrosine-type recombinase/integrase [Acidaminobacter sp. JC074]MCH4891194.1 site-specific integrase [Acidaminobacter sp. JC074]
MNTVDPIRDYGKLKDIEEYLKRTSERNWLLFITGTNTALRISDILPLRVRDVRNKQTLTIKLEKTEKVHTIQLNKKLRKAFRAYCKDKPPDEYVFKSRIGKNSHIKRGQAYNIINETCLMFGLDNIGTHTLRKTYGYHFYEHTKDVATLQAILGHRSPTETLIYIGKHQESVNKSMNSFEL